MQISLVTRAVSDVGHRHSPSKIRFRYGRIAGLTMHGRCLEWRETVQSKKEMEEIGRVSRFVPSRAIGYVPFNPGNPHLRSIDLLARSAMVVDPSRFRGFRSLISWITDS